MKLSSAIAALVVLVLTVATAKPADTPEQPAKSLAELKAQARQEAEKTYGPLTRPDKVSIHTVIDIQENQGVLLASTQMAASNQRQRLQFTDVSGQGGILYLKPPPQSPDQSNTLFFDYTDLTPPDVIETHIQVISHLWQLQLVRDSLTPEQTVTTTLIQTMDPFGVTLRIEDMPESNAGQPTTRPAIKLKFEADSFAALRRAHPTEVDRYLRPLFSDLHLDAHIFAADPRIAWQVLGDTWQAPPSIAGTVKPLLEQLNDDVYARRADADKQLRDLGADAALYLLSADRSSWSAEQKARVDAITSRYRQLTAEQVKFMRSDVDFLLDCMNSSEAALRQAGLDRLQKVLGRNVDFDLAADAAARSQAINKLRQQFGAAAR